jgi:hypothetical protein
MGKRAELILSINPAPMSPLSLLRSTPCTHFTVYDASLHPTGKNCTQRYIHLAKYFFVS